MADQFLIARQPILDAQRRIFAYELMYHQVPTQTKSAQSPDGFVNDLVKFFNPVILAAGRLIAIKLSSQAVIAGAYEALPSDQTIIELAAGGAIPAELPAACQRLRSAGYQLSLHGHDVHNPAVQPLLASANYIKVNLPAHGTGLPQLMDLRRANLKLIANGVMTHEQFRAAVDGGADLFQGFFFFKPQVLEHRDIPAMKSNSLRFLQAMNRPDLDVKELERVIRQDAAISVALLRLINSAAFGMRQTIRSIQHALVLLGEKKVRQWAASLAVSNLASDQPAELVSGSLIRAYLCEAVGRLAAMEGRQLDLFMTGIISGLPAMLGVALVRLLDELSIGPEIREALEGCQTRIGSVFALAMAHESGDFTKMTRLAGDLKVNVDQLTKAYLDSTNEVKTILSMTSRMAA